MKITFTLSECWYRAKVNGYIDLTWKDSEIVRIKATQICARCGKETIIPDEKSQSIETEAPRFASLPTQS